VTVIEYVLPGVEPSSPYRYARIAYVPALAAVYVKLSPSPTPVELASEVPAPSSSRTSMSPSASVNARLTAS
jgi:hypothetical protein